MGLHGYLAEGAYSEVHGCKGACTTWIGLVAGYFGFDKDIGDTGGGVSFCSNCGWQNTQVTKMS